MTKIIKSNGPVDAYTVEEEKNHQEEQKHYTLEWLEGKETKLNEECDKLQENIKALETRLKEQAEERYLTRNAIAFIRGEW